MGLVACGAQKTEETTPKQSKQPLRIAVVINGTSGIRQMIELERQMLRLDVVMVGMFITGMVGFGLDKVLRLVEQCFISPALSSREK